MDAKKDTSRDLQAQWHDAVEQPVQDCKQEHDSSEILRVVAGLALKSGIIGGGSHNSTCAVTSNYGCPA